MSWSLCQSLIQWGIKIRQYEKAAHHLQFDCIEIDVTSLTTVDCVTTKKSKNVVRYAVLAYCSKYLKYLKCFASLSYSNAAWLTNSKIFDSFIVLYIFLCQFKVFDGICSAHKFDHILNKCGSFCVGFVSHTKGSLSPVPRLRDINITNLVKIVKRTASTRTVSTQDCYCTAKYTKAKQKKF